MDEKRLQQMAEGEVLLEPIVRYSDRSYLVADTVIASHSGGPQTGVELIALGFRRRLETQSMSIEKSDAKSATLKAGELVGQTEIVDLGAIRMPPAVAMNAVFALFDHMLKLGLTNKAAIQERLRKAKLID